MSVYRITASTVSHFPEFGQGALTFFELEAGGIAAAKQKIYTDHPDVLIAWIGAEYLKPTFIDYGLEGSKEYIDRYGPRFEITEPLDYIRDRYKRRLEASKLPVTMENGHVELEGDVFHVKNGCIVSRFDGVKQLFPFEHCGIAQYTSVKIPYKEWRNAMISGRFKWIWA